MIEPHPSTRSDSVGIVKPQRVEFREPITLHFGKSLPQFELIYETYGELNAAKSNAILVCHALSGHHHAAGFNSLEETRPGWWDNCIGPGKPIDTSKFFVVSLNNLGGCHGSTGPRSINPTTGIPYGGDFPTVTVKDWVNTQAMLADCLGIGRFAAVVGGSLGGMQALQWAIDYPDRVANALVIACASKLSAQNIAFNEIARLAIQHDPSFLSAPQPEERRPPRHGLGLARMIGHVTYLSDDSMGDKFGRDLQRGDIDAGNDVQFKVESYLRYQGEKFADEFDPHTYLLITKVLDYFDPARPYGDDMVAALQKATARFLVISFSSDWRFAPERSAEITDALIAAGKNVSSADIESPSGHDSFLLVLPRYHTVLRTYMDRVYEDLA